MTRISLSSNISSLTAQRNLSKTTDALSETFTRLSSGMRINRASDDAAGLSISSSLTFESRIFNQAIRNVNDGISMLSIAESALSELSSITLRQIELSEQAANGTLSLTQRKALHDEAVALSSEYNRIIATASFNNEKLFDANNTNNKSIAMGFGEADMLDINIGDYLQRFVGTGSFELVPFAVPNNPSARGLGIGDFNGNGSIDFATINFDSGGNHTMSVYQNNSDGTFSLIQTLEAGASPASNNAPFIARDISGNGIIDLVHRNSNGISIYYGNGDGTFQNRVNLPTSLTNLDENVRIGDVTGNGLNDIVTRNGAYVNNGDGTFTENAFGFSSFRDFQLADLNGDGIMDVVGSTGAASNVIRYAYGNGDGTFTEVATINSGLNYMAYTVEVGDLNNNGLIDIVAVEYSPSASDDLLVSVLMNNGDGTFSAPMMIETLSRTNQARLHDMNGNGILDLVTSRLGGNFSVFYGNGDGTFQEPIITNYSATGGGAYDIEIADFSNNGAQDILIGRFNSIAYAVTEATFEMAMPYLLSREGALNTLETSKLTLDRINRELGNIGSLQSRLEVSKNNLFNRVTNLDSASSAIKDADIAIVAAENSRLQILQQSATAVLAQANLQYDIVLKLLS